MGILTTAESSGIRHLLLQVRERWFCCRPLLSACMFTWSSAFSAATFVAAAAFSECSCSRASLSLAAGYQTPRVSMG
eukprot:2911018-Amphidinium_carterae.1